MCQCEKEVREEIKDEDIPDSGQPVLRSPTQRGSVFPNRQITMQNYRDLSPHLKQDFPAASNGYCLEGPPTDICRRTFTTLHSC